MYDIYSALANLKTVQPAMESTTYTLSVGNLYKSIHINHSSMNITVIGNFDITSGTINPAFQSTGYWYDYLSGDSIFVSNTTANITLQAGEYHIYTSLRVPLSTTITAIDDEPSAVQIGAVSFYPNPSSELSFISFDSDKKSDVSIQVFDLIGNEIAVIANEKNLSSGHHEWQWNLKNKSGAKVSKGIYFIRVMNNGAAVTGKIIVD